MIIKCISCDKQFEVNSELIPAEGRSIQCGSCNHVWFFKKNTEDKPYDKTSENTSSQKRVLNKNERSIDKSKISKKNNDKALVKYQKKNTYTIGKFLRHLLVLILSLISLIIVLDTLKSPLSVIFPNLELVLFNLKETMKDIFLFLQDLLN